jgi:hypothetical protein
MNIKVTALTLAGMLALSSCGASDPTDQERSNPTIWFDQTYVDDPGSGRLVVHCWKGNKIYIFKGASEAAIQVFENHKDCEGK